MDVVADGHVVVALTEDVALGGGVIVAGQQVLVALDGQGLRRAGLEQAGLAKVEQLDGGLLHQVGLLILAVGSLRVDLHGALAGHLAGVGDGDGHGDGVLADLDAVERLLKGGVAQGREPKGNTTSSA